MGGLKDLYQEIQPVTLRLAEESVTSSLYCSPAEGMEACVSSLVEAFLVEVYRCRVCQYTSGQRTRISTHVAERHDVVPSSHTHLPCLEKEARESLNAGMGVDDEEEELDQNSSPYDLENDLHSGSKNTDDQMDHMSLERMPFLLPMYGMLQNISPRSCDIGLGSNSDGSLHVAQTCEVSTLFEAESRNEDSEEEVVFQLEGPSTDLPASLSCGMETEDQDEEMAQSAHLMTLGLYRISSTKGLPPSSNSEGRQAPTAGMPDILEASPEDKRTSPSVPEIQKQVEDEAGLSCVLCQVEVSSRSLLEVHLKCHHGKSGFRCPRCGWEAQEWSDMECHWKGHRRRRGAKSHKCGICLRTFRRAESRDAHEKRHSRSCRSQSESQPVMQCSLCHNWFSSTWEWEIHQRCHFQGGFKCLHCDFTEKTWKKVQKHIANHHKQHTGTDQQASLSVDSPKKDVLTESPYPKCLRGVEPESWCQTGKKKVKQGAMGKQNRGVGQRLEEEPAEEGAGSQAKKLTGRKEFCCTLCDRKFSTKLTLRRHMGIHQGEKPFECPHCSYCTRLKASLTQHVRVHTGEKPYKCSQCSYASIDRSSLRRHSRTHTQEKPYSCQYCPYSSIQKKSLDLHSRRHHTGESFPCHLCQYCTPDRQLLLRHMRKHHGSDPSSAALGQKNTQHSSVLSGGGQRPWLSK